MWQSKSECWGSGSAQVQCTTCALPGTGSQFEPEQAAPSKAQAHMQQLQQCSVAQVKAAVKAPGELTQFVAAVVTLADAAAAAAAAALARGGCCSSLSTKNRFHTTKYCRLL
jgi:hypothetical protein